jgi:hypothetical protein
MYDARLSTDPINTVEHANTYRNFNDTGMRPILEEIEEENLLSSGSNNIFANRPNT